MDFSLEIVGDFFDNYLMKLNNICFGVIMVLWIFFSSCFFIVVKNTVQNLPSQPFLRL